MKELFIDFHCHPQMKPYGKSFKTKAGQNTINRKSENSIWFYDSPNIFERALQLLTGVVKFTQADCTTLSHGNVNIVCASLYPIEKGFFANEMGTGAFSDLANDFVTSVSKKRVNYIQGITNYFEDLEREYQYYEQLSGKEIKIGNETKRYKVISSFREIEDHLSREPESDCIFIIITIEGMHSLNSDIRAAPDAASFLDNLNRIKEWPHKPFFVTLAHHFYNELCGHAKSLTGLVGNKTDQSLGLNMPFTALGHEVVKKALDNTDGKRILIDIKHMSALARQEYYKLLADSYPTENIPIIVSHGACNGMRSLNNKTVEIPETGHKMLSEEINFYDDEIIKIARTNGIFGLQLDERRIANAATLKATKHSIAMNKIRHYRAELLWNQVQHIAELLDHEGLFAWNTIAIGSDFDGVINPLNGFLTAETLPHLLEYLERYAYNYMEGRGKTVLKDFNQISPSEIVNRIFIHNGYEFLRRFFV